MSYVKIKQGDRTKERILKAGLDVWPNVTVANIARACKLTHAGVLYHYETGQLRDAVAEYAVETGQSKIIVQLITEKHSAIKNMDSGEKAAHFFAT